MADFLSRLASGFGRGVEMLGTLGTADLFREREAQNNRQLGNILSMQSIPAFARPGGAEPDSPGNIRNIQLQQLNQLGTPQALEMLGKLSPMNQSPEKQQALGYLSNILSQKYGLPAEQVNAMLMGGVDPSALGSLFKKEPVDLVQTYDPATGQMVYTPKSQAAGKVASAPVRTDRKIVEQDGVQYYTDTGQPVIASPIKPFSTKELKEITVPGLEIVDGAIPTKDDAKTIKTIKQASTQLEGLVSDYEGLVKKYGYTTSLNKGGKLIEQKKAQIDLQAKNLEELGALQQADREVLGDMLGNPVNAINPFNAQEVALAQINDYKKYLSDRYSTALETRGYKALKQGGVTKEQALQELKSRGKI